jgi:hypothetical protein
VKIPTKFLEEAKLKCRPEAECPALLFGRGETVIDWRWLRNVLNSPVAFLLDPEEMYRVLTEAEVVRAGAGGNIPHTPRPANPKPRRSTPHEALACGLGHSRRLHLARRRVEA